MIRLSIFSSRPLWRPWYTGRRIISDKMILLIFQLTLKTVRSKSMMKVCEPHQYHSFPSIDISIPRGTCMLIPTYVIHHDPTYYPDPDKFDPERFDKETANGRPRMTFLLFGDGPRNCIGERFAQNQSKVGLDMIIRNFKLEVCERTCKTYIKHAGLPLLAPLDELYLKFRKI